MAEETAIGRLKPESAALVKQFMAGNREVLDHSDLPALRGKMAAFMRACGPTPLPIRASHRRIITVADRQIASIVYWPLDAEGGAAHDSVRPILLYFHGGAFTHFSAETHDAVARYICNRGRCIVLNVDYRLAPEHK